MHAFGEIFGQRLQARMRRDRRLRRASARSRPIANSGLPCERSISQSTSGGPTASGSMKRSREAVDVVASQRFHGEAPEHAFLLEREQDLAADRTLGELDRARREHDEDAPVDEVAGEVVERFPRRAVGEVDVVEDDDERRGLREPGEQVRERGELADQRRRRGRRRRGSVAATLGRSAARSSMPGAAELGDRLGFERAEMLLERLDPQPERRGRAERIGACGEADRVVRRGCAPARRRAGSCRVRRRRASSTARSSPASARAYSELELARSPSTRPTRSRLRGSSRGRGRRRPARAVPTRPRRRRPVRPALSACAGRAGGTRRSPRPPTRLRTRSEARIWPGPAASQSRRAITTGRPK